jgi:lipopolysaccharide transport system ATP-binding protein
MSQVAIEAHELGKSFKLGMGKRGYGTLREALVGGIQQRAAKLTRRGSQKEETDWLWALKDISFAIENGEAIGLIGHNGAGKSTLLKILSRIIEPTTGYADVTGRVGSLLEVGTGFHPELTGRENVFLNGAILGMRRAEIRSRFDEIVAFADIERFLDTPVKRYSSGMSVRLAFAVAAHLEPEILLVDEVLAVGDAAFQRRSLAKMNDVAKEGSTVVFVSHNLATIQALCTRGILLERGQVIADGPVQETVNKYLRSLERAASQDLLERTDRDRRGWKESLIRRVNVQDVVSGEEDVVVGGRPAKIVIEVTEVLPLMDCQLTVSNSLGHPVMTFDSTLPAPADVRDESLGPRLECDLAALSLIPGRYRIDLVLRGNREIQDGLQAAAFFDVEPGVIDGRPIPPSGLDGDVMLPHVWRLPG